MISKMKNNQFLNLKLAAILSAVSILISSCNMSEQVYNDGLIQQRKYKTGQFIPLKNNGSLRAMGSIESNHPILKFVEPKKPSFERNDTIAYQKVEFPELNQAVAQEVGDDSICVQDSCDEIILRNGDIIQGKVLEIGVTEIKYKKCEFQTGPTYSVLKTDVFMVRYANGSKDVFNNNENTVQKQNQVQEQKQSNNTTYETKETDANGILSLIFGSAGLFIVLFVNAIGGVLPLIGLILGIVGLNKINRHPDEYKGKTAAALGTILSAFSIAISLLFLLSL